MTCGAAAVEAAQAISADLFLLGVTGVHATAGLTTGDVEEAAMKRALAGRAADTFVLASAEKIGVASPYRVLPFGDIAGIVTDTAADDPTVAAAAGPRRHHPHRPRLTRTGGCVRLVAAPSRRRVGNVRPRADKCARHTGRNCPEREQLRLAGRRFCEWRRGPRGQPARRR